MKQQIIMVSQRIGQFTIQNSPTILTVAAGFGVIATGVSAGRAAVKASRILEELEYKSVEKPTKRQKIKAAAPYFISPTVSAAATITCILCAHKIHLQREAALAAAYTLMDSKYKDYRDQVLSEIGEKKENRLQDQAAQKRVNDTYSENGLNIIRTKYGDILFMDSFTGRYFYSSYEHVERAKLDLTALAQKEMSASLNDFYYLLEIPEVEGGKLLGWNICDIQDDTGSPVIPIVTNRTCKTPTPEQLPCTIIDYEIEPLIDFDKCF